MSSVGYFELHVGFPDGEASHRGLQKFLEKMRQTSSEWTHSEVESVSLTRPGCIDPHNVPGTLTDLVSLQIQRRGRPWDQVIEEVVLPACERALACLAELHLDDVRLEIEYPFGYCSGAPDRRGLGPLWLVDPPVSIEAAKLELEHGSRLPDVPKWEIHFVVEKLTDDATTGLQIDEVQRLLAPHDVDIEQTIQYRSESMRQRGGRDYKFIGTAYYETAAMTEREAKRLLEGTRLRDTFAERGYSITLILEHIVGCFQPFVPLPKHEDRPDAVLAEVESAR